MLDLSPDEFRRLGYRAVDLIAERLAALESGPVRQPVPADLRDALMRAPLPAGGASADALLDRAARLVFDYPMGNAHPRFFGWVNSPPGLLGALGELLAAATGPSVAGGDQAGVYMEHAALAWIKALLGFPDGAGGILTSGGSVANLIGLAVMRHVATGGAVRSRGMDQTGAPLVVYGSAQGHSCIQKAIELLGLGSEQFRVVPTDSDFRIDMNALGKRIAEDRAAGRRPACVAASAGTVNTGAIDPLDALADLCAREGMWLHVDGAYGGFGILAEQTAGLYAGLDRADSLAVDPHKWLSVPVECGCALVRDAAAMRDTFSLVPPYLRDPDSLPWFSEFGIQQTRGFRALKLWLLLQAVGEQGYRAAITRDVGLARRLQAALRARDDFEVVAAGPLSVTCFRYAPDGAVNLDGLNRRLLALVQREGRAFLTGTELDGRFVLRACIVNYRTTEADVDALPEILADAGRRSLAAP